jgi:D-cysteine desulfhydrase
MSSVVAPTVEPADSATAVASASTVAPSPVAAAPGVEARRPLFAAYPELGRALPVVELATLPTPLEHARALGDALGLPALYLKRDDRAADPYGGNKVRKLELVLAEARRRGHRSVVTFGGVGSNHALATAIYGRRAGLAVKLRLLPEPPSAHVRHNLLAELAAGAELSLGDNATIDALVRGAAEQERLDPPTPGPLPTPAPAAGSLETPYVIAPGGSSLLGNVGYVNAAFELRDQIAAGLMPEPTRLYVAAGTLGTAVGLAVGLRAAGLRTQVRAVRVSSTKYVSDERVRLMARDTVRYLRTRAPSFPAVELGPDALVLDHSQVGRGYALPTAAGTRAAALAHAHGLELDPTYTAKTFAALVRDAPTLGAEVVLFWDTYDPRTLDAGDASCDALAPDLRSYCTHPAAGTAPPVRPSSPARPPGAAARSR